MDTMFMRFFFALRSAFFAPYDGSDGIRALQFGVKIQMRVKLPVVDIYSS